MTTYIASTEDIAFRVRAVNYTEAALRAARRLYPTMRRKITTARTTGHPALSGWFQAYVPARPNGLTSYGKPFHLKKAR